jgi:hypothetical protein
MCLPTALVVACLVVMSGCSCVPAREASLDEQVALLIASIDSAGDAKELAAEFAALERLGKPAVPYIIKRMDDRWDLRVPRVVLENPPTTFETHRIYVPKKTVDALAALLNQLTGVNFGFIYNGATDEARARSVAQWRAWCLANFPAVRDGCVP